MLDVFQINAHGLREGRIAVLHGDGFLCDVFADLVGLAVDLAADRNLLSGRSAVHLLFRFVLCLFFHGIKQLGVGCHASRATCSAFASKLCIHPFS